MTPRLGLAATFALLLAGALGAQLATAGPGFRDASTILIAANIVLLVLAVASAWLEGVRIVCAAELRTADEAHALYLRATWSLAGCAREAIDAR